MHTSIGKRRRPLWLGSGTVLACVLAVISIGPAAAGLYAKKNAVITSWTNFEARVLRGGRRNSQQIAQPMTVVLGHEYDNRNIRPHRRMQQTKKNDDETKSDDQWLTETPTFSPSQFPSPEPSHQPSRGTNRAEDEPTTGTLAVVRPQSPIISKSTKDTQPPVQPLRFAAVPVGFDVSLETQSQQDLVEMAEEAKAILEDYLMLSFREGFSGAEGIIVRSVDLNVKPFLTEDAPQRKSRGLLQLQRFLQRTRAITLEARGVAGFQVNRNEVDTDAFLQEVNSIIDETLQPEPLMDLFQNSTSGLSEYRVAQVTNTENPEEDEEDRPTMVEIIIALILIVLAAAGLVAYACIFWKKHKKRQKRRKQLGVGHKPPSPYKVPPRGRPHGASVTPTANSTPHMATIPPTMSASRPSYPTRDMGSSSSESSYKGLGSESEEDDTDTFAKELRLAATLDRRAWDDFQQRKQQLTEDGHIVEDLGNVSIYNPEEGGSYRGGSGIEMEARSAGPPYSFSDELPPPPRAVGLTVTGDTVSIQSANSFPYGDENEQTDYLPTSSLYGVGEKSGTFQDSQAEGQWDSYMTNGGRSRDVMPRETFENEWHMTESAAAEVSKKKASRGPLSFLYHSEKKEDPDTMPLYYSTENTSDPTSGAVRGSPMSHSWSTNPRTAASSSTQNATASVVRGSRENSSSWSSVPRTLSPRHSPPSGSANFGSTGAVNDDNASSGEESDAMLTSDIVQEVQRLSQFVKTYEKKKERRSQRRGADVSYDSTLDTSRDQSHHSSSNRNQHAPILFTKQVRTSSTHSLTPTHSLEGERKFGNSMSRSRSKEDEIHRVDSMPSSDSSDIETLESDRRLGISPFAVQKPPGYQNPVTKLSTEHSLLQSSNKASNQSGRFGSPIQKENTPKFHGNNRSPKISALSSLRHSEAILDGSSTSRPSDEDSTPMPRNDREEPTNQSLLRNPQSIVAPRKRTRNRGFNSIISMFEAKEKEPLYPPSESWQYNGSRPSPA